MKGYNYILLFLAAMAILFVDNGQLVITDPVESNYALTSKEMVLSGNWLVPQIFGHAWFDKPIMFYWLTALGYKLFGFNEFASRFFPAVFGILGIAFAIWSGKRLFKNNAGYFAGWILISTIEYFLIAKSVITDMPLFIFFNGGLMFFLFGYREKNPVWYYLMYAFFGLAVLTKGPMGIVLPGLIIGLFLLTERNLGELKRLKLFSGLALFSVVGLSWYALMTYLHGIDFLNGFLGIHNVLRATVSEHPRDNVIYYYTLVLILALFPWSSLLPQLLKKELYANRRLAMPSPEVKFLLIWSVVIFVFFQCMATKYITYTFPMLFPLALLLGNLLAKSLKIGYLPLLFNSGFYMILGYAAWYCKVNNVIQLGDMTMFLAIIGLAAVLPVVVKLLGRSQYCVAVMIAMALAVNYSLLDKVAVPMAEGATSKSIINELNIAEDTVYVYGNYPVSAAFYSDKSYIRLVDRDAVDSFKPKKFDWSSKNMMPYAVTEDTVNQPGIYVLMRNKETEYFKKNIPGDWNTVYTKANWSVMTNK